MWCDDQRMLEYGQGVDQSTGHAGGQGSGLGGGTPDDLGGAAVSFVTDGVDSIAALPPEMLLLLAVLILASLYVLKRAF
jgi:hypothetical protein